MRFFSKIVFVFNVCFLIGIPLRLVEMSRKAADPKAPFNGVLGFQPLESTLVILGYSAIYINFVFLIFCAWWFVTKKIDLLPKWLVWFNLIMFAAQVYYFFFSKL